MLREWGFNIAWAILTAILLLIVLTSAVYDDPCLCKQCNGCDCTHSARCVSPASGSEE